jgi:hypothetical protein
MAFSTTPFVFNPDNLEIGFDGTPFNGRAIAFTEHAFGIVPAPGTASLFFLAGATLLLVGTGTRTSRGAAGRMRSRPAAEG